MRRKHLRLIALGLGIVCLLAMFKPGYSHATPSEGEEHTRFQLGLPFSPWFHFEKTHIDRRVESATGFSHTMAFNTAYGFELITWSGLLGLVGIGFLFLARMLKRAPAAKAPRP